MTRSHKIGWLVLAVALLFALWRLPRLHGQGFGSFSHDQPFLAADAATSTASTPPRTNLQAWWHWEDVNTYATNWVDRITGYSLTQAVVAVAGTNDGVGIYFTGTAHATNEYVDIFSSKGVATFIVASFSNSLPNRALLESTGGDEWRIQNYDFHYWQAAEDDLCATNWLVDDVNSIAISHVSNYGEVEGWLNGQLHKKPVNVYDNAHDRFWVGNNNAGTLPFEGRIYDIIVYTNIWSWSTSTVPTIASLEAWKSNTYNRAITVTSPTNISGYPVLAWYVADNTYTNGSTYTVPDLYTNAWHLTNMAAAGTWPLITNAINGHSYLRFDGSDDYLTVTSVTNSQPTEFFFVTRFTTNAAAAAAELIFRSVTDTPKNSFYYESSSTKFVISAGNDVYCLYPNYTNQWIIGNWCLRGTGSRVSVNDTGYSTFNYFGDAATNSGPSALSGLIVGNGSGYIYPAHLQFAEMIIFKTNLPPSLRKGVNQYLKTKYGL